MVGDYRIWSRSVLAYTIAGCTSAAMMGTTLGVIGHQLALESFKQFGFYVAGVIGLLLAAREWGWISFPLPERKQQTEKVWAHDFGFVMASAMWGFHIGWGFFTRVTYGGFWVLVAIALLIGDPLYDALLMLLYWLGRVLPVWVAPALLGSGSEAVELPDVIFDHSAVYHRMTAVALVWSALIAVLLALSVQAR